MSITHYDCLNLPCDASPEQIKSRYRLLTRLYHPDKYQQDHELQQYAQDRMQRLNEAYSVLSHPQSRTQYHQTLGLTSETEPSVTAQSQAELHYHFAEELRDLVIGQTGNPAHSMCQHLETCMRLTHDATLRLNATMGLIELLVVQHEAFHPKRIALENARRLCAEVCTAYPNTPDADNARAFSLDAALALGNSPEVKSALDDLVLHTTDPEVKARAFFSVASFYRGALYQYPLAIAYYEMAYGTSQQTAMQAQAAYDMARCYDSDLHQYAQARHWYAICQQTDPHTKCGQDCGWRIEWLRDK